MKILVTAGPTREAIDPVRFISNRSSGKMGFAVAAAAAERGHEVVLVAGATGLPSPAGVRRVDACSAEDMLAAVRGHLEWCDVLVMAAAVADWRAKQVSSRKLKKDAMRPCLELEPTPDILASIRDLKGRRLFVGFAAETGDPVPEARRKLQSKGLDLVVANDVSRDDAGFEVDTNKVTFLPAQGPADDLPLMSKRDIAKRLLDWVEGRADDR